MSWVTTVWSPWTKIRDGFLGKMTCIIALITRLTIAQVFIQSGWGKLHDIGHVVRFFTQLGLPAPEFQARFVAITELVCGGLILLGWFTRLASIPLSITMVVAIFTARRAELGGFDDLAGFIEYLYIVLLIWLVVEGSGKISLDYFLAKKFALTPPRG